MVGSVKTFSLLFMYKGFRLETRTYIFYRFVFLSVYTYMYLSIVNVSFKTSQLQIGLLVWTLSAKGHQVSYIWTEHSLAIKRMSLYNFHIQQLLPMIFVHGF